MSQAQLIRLPAVCLLTGLKRSTVYKLTAQGQFPKPVKLGRASAWVASEIETWVSERIADRAA